jgi:hypothetical protein
MFGGGVGVLALASRLLAESPEESPGPKHVSIRRNRSFGCSKSLTPTDQDSIFSWRPSLSSSCLVPTST